MSLNKDYITLLKKKLKSTDDFNKIITYEREHSSRCQVMTDNELCKYLLNHTKDGGYYFNNVINWINQDTDLTNKYYIELEKILSDYGLYVENFIQWMLNTNVYFEGWTQKRILLYLFRKNKNDEYNWETQLRIWNTTDICEEDY